MKHQYAPKPAPVWIKTGLFALIASTISLSGHAQTTKEKVDPAAKPEETVVLSPFVVNAEDSTGYAATSTLAGTRLKTNLRDLGSAITVVTPEFMSDTGVTSIEELLTYTPSTEVGGAFGNYSAAGLTDGAGRADQDAARREPQVGARVRGLASPNYTRGYFSTSLATDAYNVGGVTFNRGANSLLFGLGSAGGVIDTGLKTADIGKNSGEVSFRYGSQGSYRATADYNFTVIPRRLALRVDLLHKQDNYRQDPAFDRESRVYAAFKGVLFENKKSSILGPTVVRGNFEAGKGQRTPPTSVAPQLGYESFFLPPPNYQPYTGQDYIAGGGYAMLAANWKKWAVNDTRRLPASNASGYAAGWYESLAAATSAGLPQLVSQNYSSSHIFAQLGVVYNGAGGTAVGIGIPSSNLQAFQGWIAQQAGQFSFSNPFINTRAYEDGAQNVGFKAPSLTDTNVFDYRNNLITGGLQEINRRFDASQITLEQTFFNNKLGFEASFDKQFYHIDYYQPFGGNNRNVPVYIDTTLYLDDNTPNPNVGRAFMLQQGDTDQWRNTWRDNKRVTGFYDLNFKDINPTLGKWFGRHTFTGLWQKESAVQKGLNYGMYWTGTNFDFNKQVSGATADNAIRNLTQFGNQVVQFAYISDDLRGKEMSQVRLRTITMPRLQDGDTFNTQYYDAVSKTYKTGSIRANHLTNGGTASQTDVTSKAFAWQPSLFNSHLIGLLGWRQDEIKNFRQLVTNARSAINEYLPSNLDLNSVPVSPVAKGNTFTWSVVGHLPKKIVEKLPSMISSVSAHYGVGENFQAISERHNIYNQSVPSPSGTTTEYGVTIGFKDDMWALKINHFESNSLFSGISGSFVGNSITEVTRALNNYKAAENTGLAFTALSNYSSLAGAGYTSYAQLYKAINDIIPSAMRSQYDYTYGSNGAWNIPNGNAIQGLTATTDTVAKGWELELTANPLPNWRISLNATQVEAVNSNSATDLAAFQSEYVANMKNLKLDNQLEGPASITTFIGRYTNEDLSPVILLQAKDGAANQELRKYRVNLVNSYDFREGRFKGFGVGGAVRWQSKVAIGYLTKLNSLNNQVPILDKPINGKSELNGDIWFSYSRKLSAKIKWKAQLNIRNAIGSQSDIPIAANPDGKVALYRIAPEKAWYLSNTFSF